MEVCGHISPMQQHCHRASPGYWGGMIKKKEDTGNNFSASS
jgi:hypothetical protein